MMERMEQIARRVAVAETITASLLLAKGRPDDLFAGVFFDIRERAKKMKTEWEDAAVERITKALATDLNKAGFKVLNLKISLGKYRGSRFVTSAKLKVVTGTQEKAEKLLKSLQTKYSPKYKLKKFDEETGIADYNVR